MQLQDKSESNCAKIVQIPEFCTNHIIGFWQRQDLAYG